MRKRIRSALGCAVLFTLSAVILFHGSDTGLPSEDYGMSVREVFYMYGDTPQAVTPVSAEHILNTLRPSMPETPPDKDASCEVLPPVLTPPRTTLVSGVN